MVYFLVTCDFGQRKIVSYLCRSNYRISMANLKALAKDTAIYGMSSIVGRFLNYLLVPLYTHVIAAADGGYGVVTNLYAFVALVLVILTFGMETTFFRFANKEGEDYHTVFSTSMAVTAVMSVLFLCGVFVFSGSIATALGQEAHPEYVRTMAVCVAIDALQAIPFSYLRFRKKAIKFAALKMLFIVLNIGLNLLYFVCLGKQDVYYVFMLNLVCTAFVTLFFIPELTHIRWRVDVQLLRRMLSYSWPILILGIAGILNQAFDKIIFPWAYTRTGLHSGAEASVELGIYGACVKIAMIMAMITQAFRYAYEPIVFAKAKDRDSKEYYAQAMKYFIIFTLFAFLCVVGYMDVLKGIIGRDYHAGLRTVPIVMAAEIMMGIYFNLSFWYKLIDRTIWGAWFSLAGCSVLCGKHHLHSSLRLHGMCVGRLCRLCHQHAPELLRGTGKEPYQLPPEVHPHLCSPCSPLLCPHGGRACRLAYRHPSCTEHSPHPPLPCSCRIP